VKWCEFLDPPSRRALAIYVETLRFHCFATLQLTMVLATKKIN